MPGAHRRNGHLPAYGRLAVCLAPGGGTEGVALACRLAADGGAHVIAIAPIEVPPDVSLETPDPAVEAAAREAVRAAQAVADAYDIDCVGTILHARHAGEAIVDEVVARGIELVLLTDGFAAGRGSARRPSRTTRYVLEHAPCRVMLVRAAEPAPKGVADTVFRPSRPAHAWPTGHFVDAALEH